MLLTRFTLLYTFHFVSKHSLNISVLYEIMMSHNSKKHLGVAVNALIIYYNFLSGVKLLACAHFIMGHTWG